MTVVDKITFGLNRSAMISTGDLRLNLASLEFSLFCQSADFSSNHCPHCGLSLPLSIEEGGSPHFDISIRLSSFLLLFGLGSFVCYRLFNKRRRATNITDFSMNSSDHVSSTAVNNPLFQNKMLPGLNWSALALAEVSNWSGQQQPESDFSVESFGKILERLELERDLLNSTDQISNFDASILSQTLPKTPERENLLNSSIFAGGTICRLNHLLGQIREVKRNCADLDQSLQKVETKHIQRRESLQLVDLDLTENTTQDTLGLSSLIEEESFKLSVGSQTDFSKTSETLDAKSNSWIFNNLHLDKSVLESSRIPGSIDAQSHFDKFDLDKSVLSQDIGLNSSLFDTSVWSERVGNNSNNQPLNKVSTNLRDKQNQTNEEDILKPDLTDDEASEEQSLIDSSENLSSVKNESIERQNPTQDDETNKKTSVNNEEATVELEWDSTDVVFFQEDEDEDGLLSKPILSQNSFYDEKSFGQFSQSFRSLNRSKISSFEISNIERPRDGPEAFDSDQNDSFGFENSIVGNSMPNNNSFLQLTPEQRLLLSDLSRRFNQSAQQQPNSNWSASSSMTSSVCSNSSTTERSVQHLVEEAQRLGLVRDLLIRLIQQAEANCLA